MQSIALALAYVLAKPFLVLTELGMRTWVQIHMTTTGAPSLLSVHHQSDTQHMCLVICNHQHVTLKTFDHNRATALSA